MGTSTPTVVVAAAFVAAAVVVSQWVALASATEDTLERCFKGKENQPPASITITCPENHVISLEEALFGRNEWGACYLTKKDCTEKTKVFDPCDGLQMCNLTVKTFSPKCGFSTVLLIRYLCVLTVIPTPSTEGDINVNTDGDDTAMGGDPHEDDSQRGDRNEARDTTVLLDKPTRHNASGKSEEDTDIIVGCVIAVIVTVIILIIAIIVVVRRLLSPSEPESEDEEKASQSSSMTGCCSGRCLNIGSIRTRRSDTPKDDLADSNHNTAPRLAPVGQEDEVTPSKATATATTTASTKTAGPELTSSQNVTDSPAAPAPAVLTDPTLKTSKRDCKSTGANNPNAHAPDKTKKPVTDAGKFSSSRSHDGIRAKDATPDSKGKSLKFDAVAIPNTESGTSC